MCEFGYVLTDENFNTIKHGDTTIYLGKGRECRFYLKGRKHIKYIKPNDLIIKNIDLIKHELKKKSK